MQNPRNAYQQSYPVRGSAQDPRVSGQMQQMQQMQNDPNNQFGQNRQFGQNFGAGAAAGVRKPFRLSEATKSVNITKKERDESFQFASNREKKLPQLRIMKSIISLYSWEDMCKLAGNIEITNLNFEGEGSVNNPRMGVINPNTACQTCSQIDCTGHFGLIRFPRPVYNPAFIKEIVSVLTCVCNSCGRLLLSHDYIKSLGITHKPFEEKLKLLKKYSKGVPCSNNHKQLGGGKIEPCKPNYEYISKDAKEHGVITYKLKGSKSEGDKICPMNIYKVIEIFERIQDEDSDQLGFAKFSVSSIPRKSLYGFIQRADPEIIFEVGLPSKDILLKLTFHELSALLSRLNGKQMSKIGFPKGSHPSNMILKGTLVPPVIARTPVYEGGSIHYDQLTHMFINIMRRVKDMETQKADTDSALYTAMKQLIFKTEGKKMGMKDFLSIIERIQGKTQLLRGLLMGKRVNHCARTVAGPNPALEFGQCGVPKKWAPILTKKIAVTDFNRNHLINLLDNGRITHVKSGKTGLRKYYDPKYREKFNLDIGDIVERWLEDGDRVVINRQPTLHRQSMIACKVKLIDKETITLPMPCCPPLNLDFDGDEVNLWCPQDFLVEAEAEVLMNVKNNIMSSEQNRPIIGNIMNSVSGAYLLTKPDTIDKNLTLDSDIYNVLDTEATQAEYEAVMNLVKRHEGIAIVNFIDKISDNTEIRVLYKYLKNKNAIKEGVRIDDNLFGSLLSYIKDNKSRDTLYHRLKKYGIHPRSGYAIFSALLPSDFYYEHNGVLILEGIMIEGRLTKSHVGASNKSIIHALWKKYGAERTSDFLTESPWVIGKWIMEHGFSVGLHDCISLATDENGREYDKNEKTLQKEIAQLRVELEAVGGELDDPIEESFRERKINNLVNITQGVGLRLAKDVLAGDNSIGVMTDQGAGTKGGIANIGQMMGIVGQQFYHGKRLPKKLTGGTRLLPIYDENDNSPEANGFVPFSFYHGVGPAGLILIQAGGREGLLDTALKTSETGNIQHRATKAAENIVIGFDLSVRNTAGALFSPSYNGGYDTAEQMSVESANKSGFVSFIDINSTLNEQNYKRGWVPKRVNILIKQKRTFLEIYGVPEENILINRELPKSPPITYTPTSFDLNKPLTNEVTKIKITKYEKARILGTRAMQLSNNYPPQVDIGDDTDFLSIAMKEYDAGVIPLFILRKLPDGTVDRIYPTLDNI